MAIDDATEIIPVINQLKKSKKFDYYFTTRDWHPSDHISFHTSHPGSEVFDTIKVKETGLDQIMWPVHCVQGSYGAQYIDGFEMDESDVEILKGTKAKVEAISAFGSDQEDTGLYTKLKELEVKTVYVVGLAFDFCVGYTAEDAAEEGFETVVIKDATKSVDPDDEGFMVQRLEEVGVKLLRSDQI